MNELVAPGGYMSAIGWTLLQSLWQGAIIGLATAAVLAAMRRATANLRYLVACAGLLAMLAAFAATAITATRDLPAPASASPAAATTNTAALPPVTTPIAAADTFLVARPDVREPWLSPEGLRVWSTLAVPLWIAGVLLLSIRLVFASLLVRRMRRTHVRPVDDAWRARFDAVAARVSVTRPCAIVESACLAVPTAIGWLRPMILLPVSVLTALPPEQLEAIVAHELAHVRRHDYLVNVLQSAIEILFFYHPASWWISRQIRREREHCCDDIAAQHCRNPLLYAQALAELETLRGSELSLGVAATDGSLLLRIRRLVAGPATTATPSSMWAPALVVAAAAMIALSNQDVQAAIADMLPAAQADRPGLSRAIPGDRGEIEGRVVDAQSGQPIPGATVTLAVSATDARRAPVAAARGAGRPRTEFTGADGTFLIADVVPSDYSLEASAPGYAPAFFGQTREFTVQGVPVRVLGGRTTRNIDVRLQATGAVSGRILDDAGKGMAGVEVQLMRMIGGPGERMPAGVAFAQTVDGGSYRFKNVLPGEYFVNAYVNGGIRPTRRDRPLAYVTTYYPEATRIDEAQTISVAGGVERFDVDFALATSVLRTVSGRLIDPGGPPLTKAHVRLRINHGSDEDRLDSAVDAEGRFEFRDLPPGTYMLNVQDPGDFYRWLKAMRDIQVVEDVTDLQIVADRPLSIDGTIATADGKRPPFDVTELGIMIQQPREAGRLTQFGVLGGHGIKADGTFKMLAPSGPSTIHVQDLPPRWMVKSVLLDGADITDAMVEIGGSGQHRLDIVLSNRAGSVTGTVTDRSGRAMTNATIVVFPEDRNYWHAERLRKTTFSHQAGAFQLDDLAPGSYRAAAVDSLPPGALSNPAVLERLWPLSTGFRLDEGEQQSVTLTLAPTPSEVSTP